MWGEGDETSPNVVTFKVRRSRKFIPTKFLDGPIHKCFTLAKVNFGHDRKVDPRERLIPIKYT